uniref:Uncharacterized protein n=1 Tax=Molossus molossus TaxID=27622 RepID=A0A7J8E2Y7_MOLMO|nr:hypothetical protein HJG59_008991 [Molossus molossus]
MSLCREVCHSPPCGQLCRPMHGGQSWVPILGHTAFVPSPMCPASRSDLKYNLFSEMNGVPRSRATLAPGPPDLPRRLQTGLAAPSRSPGLLVCVLTVHVPPAAHFPKGRSPPCRRSGSCSEPRIAGLGGR